MTGVDTGSAIRLSLVVAGWAVLLSAPIATALGWLLARREFPGKGLLSAVILAPMVLPPVVTGLVILTVLGRSSALGRALDALGLPVSFTLAGAVIAALVVALPLFVAVARAAFEAVDPRYEEVAAALGDPPWRAFRRVTLPLALPGLAAGAVLTFARAMGEFGATVIVAGNMEGRTRTIALAVYALLDLPGGEAQAWTLVWASVGLSSLALLGYERLLRAQKRRLELWRG